jgi:hypothetical protein
MIIRNNNTYQKENQIGIINMKKGYDKQLHTRTLLVKSPGNMRHRKWYTTDRLGYFLLQNMHY